MEQGTTPNGVFGAKLMWGYLGDFVSLLRNIPEYRDLPLADLLPTAFPELTFVRVVRANKVRQAVSLWKAVQTATWTAAGENARSGPETPTSLRTSRSSTSTSRAPLQLQRDLPPAGSDAAREASWDAFFEHARIKPVLVLYENFAADYTRAR